MQTLIAISPEEYLASELHSTHKSEYHAGEVVAMAGAQTAHNRIVVNLSGELYMCLRLGKCELFPSDMLLALPACEKFVYPDLMIVCAEPDIEKNGQNGLDFLRNPSVIIEVTSKSTAQYDKTEKMDCYLKLDSLVQYVIVDSEAVHIRTYTRTPQNDWLLHIETDKNQKIKISNCEISLTDIYNRVGF